MFVSHSFPFPARGPIGLCLLPVAETTTIGRSTERLRNLCLSFNADKGVTCFTFGRFSEDSIP